MHLPGEDDLKRALGPAWVPVGALVTHLHATHTGVTAIWQFSPRSGWYQVHLLKKRRLLYLIPKRGDFRLMMILGGKALARLQSGPFASRVTRLLKAAKRYPEGMMFAFDHASFDADLLEAFLEAKTFPALPAGHVHPSRAASAIAETGVSHARPRP